MNKLALAAVLSLFACKSAPEVVPVAAPELPLQEFVVVTQNLNQVQVKYTGTVQAEGDFTLVKANWEFVEDGVVKHTGETPLSGTTFELTQTVEYVTDEAELKALAERGGSLLLALRGTLFVQVGEQVFEVPFARSREVRTPRLPHLKFLEVQAGRFSDEEVQATFQVGVVNPNPFEILLHQLDYTVELAGKEVTKGTLGKGDRVSPASTGVFEIPSTMNEETHGKDAGKVIKGRKVPYVLNTTLSLPLFSEPLESRGEITLTK